MWLFSKRGVWKYFVFSYVAWLNLRVWVREREITFLELCLCRGCHRAFDESSLQRNHRKRATSVWLRRAVAGAANQPRDATAQPSRVLSRPHAQQSRLCIFQRSASFARWRRRSSCSTSRKRPRQRPKQEITYSPPRRRSVSGRRSTTRST